MLTRSLQCLGAISALSLLTAFALSACSGGTGAISTDDAGTNDASSLDDGASADGDVNAASCAPFRDTGGAVSNWAHADANGRLAYATLPKGERLLDFSNAGYGGGGVGIPDAPVQRTVAASGADDTAAIQSAIDAVAQLAPTNGIRGAVLLLPGTFQVSGVLTIAASGVVLRGSGSRAGGSNVNVTGAPRTFLAMGGVGSRKTTGTPAKITDAYVPSGARTFHVDDASAFSAGATIVVERPVTADWIHFMGMDTLVRNGVAQTWLAPGTIIPSDRVVAAVSGNAITIDAPLSDSLDAQYTSATVTLYTFAGRIENVGLESMHVVAPAQTVPINQPTYDGVAMNAVVDAWIRDVVADDFTNGFVVGDSAKWITIEDSTVTRTAPIDGSQGYPFHYSIDGQATLVQRCASVGDDIFSYATKSRSPGPNVVLRFSARGTHTNVQPHERWSTGLLLDGIDAPTSGIALMDRGYYGTGHGWTIGFSVVWNSVGTSLLIQQPPGAQNWAIGSSGMLQTAGEPGSASTTPIPSGIVDSQGVIVAPKSLYLAQLCERLGRGALTNIGY